MAAKASPRKKAGPDLLFKTQAEVAAYLDISIHTLADWKKGGCPVGGGGPYSARAICRWLCGEKAKRFKDHWGGTESRDRASDARARKDEVDAQLKELELQRRLGNLCELPIVRRVFAEGLIRTRKHLERLHVRLRPQMPRENADGICAAIVAEVRRILESLAGGWNKELEEMEGGE